MLQALIFTCCVVPTAAVLNTTIITVGSNRIKHTYSSNTTDHLMVYTNSNSITIGLNTNSITGSAMILLRINSDIIECQ